MVADAGRGAPHAGVGHEDQGASQCRQRSRVAGVGRGALAPPAGDAAGARRICGAGAPLAAVAGMPGPLVMIAGGDGKNQDFAPLAAAFRGKVRHAVLIGRDAALIERALAGVCTLETCATLPAAVRAAARAALPGDTVLLSPACASLDMLRDYSHRGAVFTQAVQELAA